MSEQLLEEEGRKNTRTQIIENVINIYFFAWGSVRVYYLFICFLLNIISSSAHINS
jgi:hypothetical protein